MWVTFLLENRKDSVVLKKYQVQDEVAVEFPNHVTTGELLNLIMSSEELLERDSVKVSIPLRMFNKQVLAPLESTSAVRQCSSDEWLAVHRAITVQQQQLSQQSAVIETRATVLRQQANNPSRSRKIRPDTFDDTYDNQERWIAFYEEAAKHNGWLSV
ncbi:hypothetical protein HPB50_012524 [Hyalomma asiaticum]|uniref:Uncharacterized protein n=1 Tax=Hyalomma asiaticum TaxID=266040 RepID=A0ACB7RR02_HYAAI|nr:hypothetical protein HPB50_012524 [Hyalomma asiaticum]